MITDILLAPDIIVNGSLELLYNSKEGAICKALRKATQENIKLWAYVGYVDTVHRDLSQKIKEKMPQEKNPSLLASKLLSDFTKDFNWLSALSEDGFVFNGDFPLRGQLSRALRRLGEGAIILTQDLSIRNFLEPSMTPEEYIGLKLEPRETIAFVDLFSQQAKIIQDIEKGFFSLLRHGKYVGGPEIRELEKKLSQIVGTKHAISCSSGTDALIMTLMALGIGKGDIVFTVPFTFAATAEAIRIVGATPVFVDIEPQTFLMDPAKLQETIEAILTKNYEKVPLPRGIENLKPKAIITVDLFGCPADYDRISEIANKYNLFVIEDAAQAFGAIYKGIRAGKLGTVGCTSFFPAKPLGAYGDGGAIFTDDDDLAYTLKLIRNHGIDSNPYEHQIIGLNGRMDSIQASVLLSKLKIFEEELKLRHKVAEVYTSKLSSYPWIRCPEIPEGVFSSWSQYSIITPSETFRNNLREKLFQKGIPTAIYYPIPLHLQKAFLDLGYKKGDFPVSEFCSSTILSLPMHPYVKEELVERISKIVGDIQHG